MNWRDDYRSYLTGLGLHERTLRAFYSGCGCRLLFLLVKHLLSPFLILVFMWFRWAYASLSLEGRLSNYDWSTDGHVTQVRPMIVIPTSGLSVSKAQVSLELLGAIAVTT